MRPAWLLAAVLSWPVVSYGQASTVLHVTVMLQANNLLDAAGRRHASFTKDFVPLAGRNVKLSVRTSL